MVEAGIRGLSAENDRQFHQPVQKRHTQVRLYIIVVYGWEKTWLELE